MKYLDATDDVEDDDFLAWDCKCMQLAKSTVNRFKNVDMFAPEHMYYVYVCSKDPALSEVGVCHFSCSMFCRPLLSFELSFIKRSRVRAHPHALVS